MKGFLSEDLFCKLPSVIFLIHMMSRRNGTRPAGLCLVRMVGKSPTELCASAFMVLAEYSAI